MPPLPPSPSASPHPNPHHRTHALLLIQRLLSLHPGASPFTLILDSLEQSGKPLVEAYIRRANGSRTQVLYVAHTTQTLPRGIDVLLRARRKDIAVLQAEIARATAGRKTLLILPTLHPFLTPLLPTFLSSLLHPQTSLLAVLHTDIPFPPSSSPHPYAPAPLPLLSYLATTLITPHSLSHTLAARAAARRSLAEPAFGLAEARDGVLVGMGANDSRGVVLEVESRRRSGRAVGGWFFLSGEGEVGLLEESEFWKEGDGEEVVRREEEEQQPTWEVGLTARQRGERERVVLPYLDAQREGGGEGGRILYDLGVEDDFDEEEDEI